MAVSELLSTSLLLIGTPAEATPPNTVITSVEQTMSSNEYAVLPKVLKVVDGEIFWIEQ